MSVDPYPREPYESSASVYAAPELESRPAAVPVSEPVEMRLESPPRAPAWWTDKPSLRQWAFFAGLAGGVLILVGTFTLALFITVFHLLGDGNPDIWFLADGNFPEAPLAVSLWGLVSGGMVLVGALRLKERDEVSALPGASMLVGGLLSFFALGGFLVGGLAAIAAGVMAIVAANALLPERRGEALPRGPRPLP